MIAPVMMLMLAGDPPKVTPELLAKGKASFAMSCAPCHGPEGKGDGPAAVALNPKPRNYTSETFKYGDKPENIFQTLEKGSPPTAMVSFSYLPEDERWALTYWVLELKKAGAPPPAPAATPAKKKK